MAILYLSKRLFSSVALSLILRVLIWDYIVSCICWGSSDYTPMWLAWNAQSAAHRTDCLRYKTSERKIGYLGIGIEAMPPASVFRHPVSQSGTGNSGTGLGPLFPVPDWFRHQHFWSIRDRTDWMPDSPIFRHSLYVHTAGSGGGARDTQCTSIDSYWCDNEKAYVNAGMPEKS